MSEFVVSSGKTAELLESIEEALDKVAHLVAFPVKGARGQSMAPRRNHGFSPRGCNRFDEGVAVIAFVRHDRLARDEFNQRRPLRNVGRIATRQDQPQWIAQRIDAGMNLCGQPAARTTDRLIATVFLGAPAACWWARTTVESMNSSSRSASPRSASATRAQTPPASQRAKRIYTECQFPNSGGRSRQGLPTRAVYKTASTKRRLSVARPPLSVGFPGSNSEIRAHCASRNIRRSIAHVQIPGCKHKSATVNRP